VCVCVWAACEHECEIVCGNDGDNKNSVVRSPQTQRGPNAAVYSVSVCEGGCACARVHTHSGSHVSACVRKACWWHQHLKLCSHTNPLHFSRNSLESTVCGNTRRASCVSVGGPVTAGACSHTPWLCWDVCGPRQHAHRARYSDRRMCCVFAGNCCVQHSGELANVVFGICAPIKSAR